MCPLLKRAGREYAASGGRPAVKQSPDARHRRPSSWLGWLSVAGHPCWGLALRKQDEGNEKLTLGWDSLWDVCMVWMNEHGRGP